jgi:hypothetical protein
MMVDEANRMLRESTADSRLRLGVMNLTEFMLHATDNYAGFRHLSKDEVPAGQLPGIEVVNGENTFPDETWISYYKGGANV